MMIGAQGAATCSLWAAVSNKGRGCFFFDFRPVLRAATEGSAPVFRPGLVKAPPKAPVPHQSGYARLASATEVRDDVFENARADACAQLASSALRSCFRLKAAAPEVRLLLELCDDRGDGDDGPKAAKKLFTLDVHTWRTVRVLEFKKGAVAG